MALTIAEEVKTKWPVVVRDTGECRDCMTTSYVTYPILHVVMFPLLLLQ